MSSDDSDDNFLSADEGSESEKLETCKDAFLLKTEVNFNENTSLCKKLESQQSRGDLNVLPDVILEQKEDLDTMLIRNTDDIAQTITTSSNLNNLLALSASSDALADNLINANTLADENEPHFDKSSNKISENNSKAIDTYKPQAMSSFADLNTCSETISNINVNKKSIKESKIGLKKPREKLAARLGNKKLGARITKPLIGISYDTAGNKHKELLTASKTPLMEKEDTLGNNSKGKFGENSKGEDFSESAVIIEEFQKFQSQEVEESSLSNWGTWSDWSSSLVSAASTLTKEVGRGMETVMESVESSLGAPDPEVLAKEQIEIEKKIKEIGIKEEQKITKEGDTKDNSENFVYENEIRYDFGFSGFGKLGYNVLLGGLETLEKIGRKTMDVIQDGDPGLRRKRAFLQSKKPSLSMVLRDARERALDEEEYKNFDLSGESVQPVGTVSIVVIWDGSEGSAHLEALSLVAKQCNLKTSNIMQEMPALGLNRLQPFISKIKACSEIGEEVSENISKELNRITRDVQLPLQFTKLLTGWPSYENFIKKLSIEIHTFSSDEKRLIDMQKDLFDEVVLVVSCIVGVTHKAAEFCLISSEINYVLLAEQFKELCCCISAGLERSADHVCEAVTLSLPSSDTFVSSSITNIYIQMAEANSYLQNSLQHLTTVLIQAQAKQIASEL